MLASTPKKLFLKKSKKVYKNAEFHADFRNVEKFYRHVLKKFINQNVSEIFHFSTFTENPKNFLLINFKRGIVLNFLQHIWNQCEILRFLIPISIFSKKKIF